MPGISPCGRPPEISKERDGITPITIFHANPAWGLLMQSGVGIACTVGIPLPSLLRDELGLSCEQLRPVDALLLDGMPVDNPEQAIVGDNARLALAAGLPGIAGLAMKQGSAVRALRGGITHTGNESPAPRPGTVHLSLYSLVLPQLAGHFFKRGVLVTAAQLIRYARFAPDDHCLLANDTIIAHDLPEALKTFSADFLFLFTAILCRN